MRLSRDLLVGLALLIAMPAWAQVGIPTPIATTGIAGKVKPDGTSISVASDGTISTLGAPPSGAAGGDLGGTYPNPTVTSGAHLSGSLASGLTIPSATMTAPALGTPASGVATNLTGTAPGMTAGNVTGTGVASATSLALGGATIGTDALGVTGTTTHNGAVVISGASFSLSGNLSAAAWTTNGIRYKNTAATLTDTTSSGTVAAAYTNVFGGSTIAASSAATFTDYYNTYIKAPVAGTNVTLTNKWAIGVDSLSIAGPVRGMGRIVSGTTDGPTAADCGGTVHFTSGSAITVTMPNSITTLECTIAFVQEGAGQITFAAASGAAIHSAHSYTKTFAQWAVVDMILNTNAGGTSAVYTLAGDGA